MVLEPITYKWLGNDGKKRKAEAYIHPDIPGLAVQIEDYEGINDSYRYYRVVHRGAEVQWISDDFSDLSEAARFLARVGELCDWREVEPGNELHGRIAPVVGAMLNELHAAEMLKIKKVHLEQAYGEAEGCANALGYAQAKLEHALATFRGSA